MSIIHEVNIRGINFTVDLKDDFYGIDWWKAVATDNWEPHTIAFLERHCKEGTILIDIGAASGAITLFAASLGSDIYSFEPNPLMFDCLSRNVELNEQLPKITLSNNAVSSISTSILFNPESAPTILSPIVMTHVESLSSTVINVRPIKEILEEVRLTSANLIYIKMDIEGAEYQILNDLKSLLALKKNCEKLFLSIHPGFSRGYKSKGRLIDFCLRPIHLIRNFIQNARLFKSISQVGSVMSISNYRIDKPFRFAGLAYFGFHDYVVVFNK